MFGFGEGSRNRLIVLVEEIGVAAEGNEMMVA